MATYQFGAPTEGSAWAFFGAQSMLRTIVEATADHIIIHRDWSDGRFSEERFYGAFTYSGQYDGLGRPEAFGRVDVIESVINGDLWYRYGDLNADMQLALHGPFDDYDGYQATVFAGADTMSGDRLADTLSSYAGDDLITAGGGNDSVDAGAGVDVVRGGDGDDVVYGGVGAAHDDLNGNAGRDTLHGGDGDDWTVGGKDDDLLYGDGGGDLVYGNLGNDTCDGGDGADVVRGGQGDDVLSGGGGDDFLSGDRGDDTVSGGAGADTFHMSGDAGLERVLDFNPAEGDRVQLDPGADYAIAQVGADTVISLAGGAQVVLVGFRLAGGAADWLFAG